MGKTRFLPVTLLIFIFLLLPATNAREEPFEDDPYGYASLTTQFIISSEVNFYPKYSGSVPKYIKVNLSAFPRASASQNIIEKVSSPTAQYIDNIIYEWAAPTTNRLDFNYQTKIESRYYAPEIRSTPYPTTFPEELIIYTLPSKNIDSDNPAIRAKASELAENEDDLFVILFKLASWTEQNIQYNLSTLTADTSQKASWVLANRIGVCDELTALFIAMARSLGIPARFISGISYTNSPYFTEPWQPHGWAEVYFPDVGWVPFDPTFGEFGYVDATHIKLQESLDPDESAVHYSWQGDADVHAAELDFDVEVLDLGPQLQPSTILKSAAIRDNVGFGSYNLILTEIENLRDTYAATRLHFSAPPEIAAEPESRPIILSPKEKKKVYWLIKVNDTLKPRYIYTFPILVHTELNQTSTAEFISSERAIVFDRDEAREFMADEPEQNNPQTSVSFSCRLYGNTTPINRVINAECGIKNTGNTIIRQGTICFDKNCSSFSLQLNEDKTIGHSLMPLRVGKAEALVRIEIPGTEEEPDVTRKSLHLPYEVLDKPVLTIKRLNAPNNAKFNEPFNITFTLERTSYSFPHDVVIELDGNKLAIQELNEPQPITYQLDSRTLREGNNTLILTITWKDIDGQESTETKNFSIILEELSFIEKLQSLFWRLNRWVNK